MKKLVNAKRQQWNLAAMVSVARHGKEGGDFVTKLWANGQTMVKPNTEWATSMNSVPQEVFEAIKAKGWMIPRNLIPKGSLTY